MKLEQTGFKIYHHFLTRIPKLALKLLLLILIMLIIVNFSMSYFAKPTFNMDQCLFRFYQQTHVNPDQYAEQFLTEKGVSRGDHIVMANPKKPISETTNKNNEPVKEKNDNQNTQSDTKQQSTDTPKKNQSKPVINITPEKSKIYQKFAFTNSTTMLRIYMSNQMSPNQNCIIETNYLENSQKQTDEDNKVTPSQKIQKSINKYMGLMLSSKFALYFNQQRPDMLKKHDLHIHRITIPRIQTGSRYLWMNIYLNQLDDFIWGVQGTLAEIGRKIKTKWEEQLKILNSTSNQTKKDEPKKNQQQKDQKQNRELIYDQVKINQTKHILDVLTSVNSPFEIYSHNHQLRYWPVQNGVPKRYNIPDSINHNESAGIFTSIYYIMSAISLIMISSILIGIFVKYCFIFLMGVFEIFTVLTGSICKNKNKKKLKTRGYIARYMLMMMKGQNNQIKLTIQISLTILAIPFLYSLASYYMITQIIVFMIELSIQCEIHAQIFLQTLVLIQIFHYIFCRSRISLRYFWYFSSILNIGVLIFIMKYPFYLAIFTVNCNFLGQLLFIATFLLLEKYILQDNANNQFKPSFAKPRMLFFMSYDLDWQEGIPPLWTTFVSWFDLGFASIKQRAYVDQNYQLLYGRLMGIDRQEDLPEESDSDEQLQLLSQDQRINQSMRQVMDDQLSS